jgi:Na+-translocating ferredoxin:NAD+ oxidoreductase RnfE subunit
MILPPGGFFALGFLLLFFNWFTQRRKRQKEAATGEIQN